MSEVSDSPTKRHCIDGDDDEQPLAVVSAFPVQVVTETTTEKEEQEESKTTPPPPLPMTEPFPDEIRTLVQTIIRKNDIPNVINALKRLSELCTFEPNCLKVYFSYGITLPLVDVMRSFSNNDEIQYLAITCLTWIALNNNYAKVSILDCGGLEATIDIMKKHSNYVGVQIDGLVLIGNVCTFVGYAATAAAATANNNNNNINNNGVGIAGGFPGIGYIGDRFVNGLDGITLIVNIMKNFPCNAKVQGIACQVLHSLSFAQNVRNKLMDAVGVVGIALERYHRFYHGHHDDHVGQIKFFGSEFLKRIV